MMLMIIECLQDYSLSLSLPFSISKVMSPCRSDQMSQQSQVSKIAIWYSLNEHVSLSLSLSLSLSGVSIELS